MKYVDIDPVEEVKRIQEQLLEKFGGIEGLRKHMAEERPKLEKQGWKFLSEEQVAAMRSGKDSD